jgi:hypothetical protein
MDRLSTLFGKPLLTDEEFSKLIEKDDDAAIWKALQDASHNDTIIHQVFALASMRGWSTFRTLMVCSYVLAQRFEYIMKLQLEALNHTTPKIVFCAHCAKELKIVEKIGDAAQS